MTPHPAALRQCLELAVTDLRREARTGEVLLVTAPFGGAALLLMPLAIGAQTPLLRQLGPGLYWVVVLLFGVIVTLRASASENRELRILLRLCRVDPVARLLARALSNAALLLGFETILALVAVAIYDPDLSGWVWMLPVLPLVAAGLATLGALADALTHDVAGRTALGPLLVAPIAVPLLLGASQLMSANTYDRPPLPWLLLVLAVDLAAIGLVLLLGRHLEEGR